MSGDVFRIAEQLTRDVQDWVRCRLAERGENQKEFAARLGMSPQYLSDLLRDRDISLRNILRLVYGLGGEFSISIREEVDA